MTDNPMEADWTETNLPGDECPSCKGKMVLCAGTSPSYDDPGNDPALLCEDCGEEYEADWENIDVDGNPHYRLTDEQKETIRKLESKIDERFPTCTSTLIAKGEIPTLNTLFEGAPDGVFKWEGDHSFTDQVPVSCGEDDCPYGWHLYTYALSMGRDANGNRWFTYEDCDSDGDADYVCGFHEGEDDPAYLTDSLASLHINHTLSAFARYAAHVAWTGEDPCNDYMRGPITPEKAIKGLKNSLN